MTALLRRAGWLIGCALLLTVFQSFFRQPVAWPLAAAVLLFAGVTAWRPFIALLVLAGVGPLAGMLMAFGRGEAGTIVLAEVLALAFLTGWSARQAVTGEPLSVTPAVRWPALLLALAAVASAIVQSAGVLVESQGQPAAQLLRLHLRDFVLHPPGSEPVLAAAVFACGVLLLVAAAHLAAGAPERRTAVLRMMVCGAAAAAALNVLRLVTVSLQREDAAAAFLELLATVRVNVQYTDRNAAGSYFAMALLLAAAVAGRARGLFALAAPLLAAAIWMSGSRFALAATAIAVISGLVASSRHARTRQARIALAVVLVGLLVAAAGVWKWYPEGRNVRVAKAFGIRMELTRAGVEMMTGHPVFGVGLSRYYALSDRYAGEALRALGFARENAHNNFVQIAAELGIPGILAFVVLIGASVRELTRGGVTREARWLGAGLAAFLLTCLGGHPLLVADAAFPFWLALGLAAAPSSPPSPPASWRRHIPVALACLLLVSIWPRTTAAMRNADLEHVSLGFSKWQHSPDGHRYRWAGGRSTFYVTSSASAVRIPLWNAAEDRLTIEVQILVEGREVNRMMLPADDRWRVARVMLKPTGDAAFTRFDLVAFRAGETVPLTIEPGDAGGAIRVARPEIEP